MRDLNAVYRMAEAARVEVDWFPMNRAQSLSIPLGEGGAIAIDPRRVESAADEKLKLCHELGHCVTGSFYNRYAPLDVRQRHELHADRWAIAQLVPRGELEGALRRGVWEVWELAEHFEVTEDFMRKALCHYGLLDTGAGAEEGEGER